MLSKKHSSCSSMGEPSIFSNPANREFIPSKKVSLSIQKILSRTIQNKSLLRTLNPIQYRLYFEIKTESGHLSLMKKKNGRSTIYSLGFVQDLLKYFFHQGSKLTLALTLKLLLRLLRHLQRHFHQLSI